MSGRPCAALLAAAALGACASANIAVNQGFDFSRVQRVAVVGFKDNHLAGSGDLVTAAFEQSLLHAGYDVVERDQVAKVLHDQRLSGALDAKSAALVGRLLSVDALVQGQITELVAPRQTVVNTTVETDQTMPVFGRHHRVQRPDGTWADTTEVDYQTKRTYVKKPEAVDTTGKLGLTARMLFAPTGAMLWSGSESLEIDSIDDAAHGIADDILKAVKSTWPKK